MIRILRSIFIILTIFPQLNSSWGKENQAQSISFGPVTIGENRLPIHLSEFKIEIDIPDDLEVKAQFIKDSVQWIRVNKVLLIPRVRIKLTIKKTIPNLISVKYLGKSTLFQAINSNKAFAKLFIPLFGTKPLEVFINGKKRGEIKIMAKKRKRDKSHLIDYSCSRYNVKISGFENEYFSAGCYLIRRGKFGAEKASLEIHWTTANYQLLDGSDPPYIAIMSNNFPVKTTLVANNGSKKSITISANIPKRLKLLKTALGFGPYLFDTKENSTKAKKEITSPLMIYAHFYLTAETSIRAFEAFIWNKSYFNNFGVYFAYNVGSALDNRVEVIPLLGFQGITFSHHKSNKKSYNKIILPQGFEILYHHAFGAENYSLVYGMFFSPKSDENYKNLWIRFGKRIFWELNYISWKEQDKMARMWGLSLGVPFLSFF